MTVAHPGPLVVERIETRILDIPLIRPHRFAALTIHGQASLLVRLHTRDGVVGIGEGVVPGGPWWGGESIEGMQAIVERYLAPAVVGEDVFRTGHLARMMERLVAGAPFARAAVEMAVWDAAAKALRVPLYRLLGGLHRTELPVTWALGADPADTVLAEATAKLDAGLHRSFKLKMGAAAPADDVARVLAVASGLRGRASVAVDLNGSWDEHTARRWLPELAAGGVTLVEQPVPGWNVDALARLRHLTGAAVMADESLCTAADGYRIAAAHAADVVALKVHKNGGIGAVQRVAAIADAAGIACYGGTTLETSVGTAAAAHAFGACPTLTAGSELFGPLLLADDIVEEPLVYRDGHLQVSDGPGLGVVLDEDKVEKYARR